MVESFTENSFSVKSSRVKPYLYGMKYSRKYSKKTPKLLLWVILTRSLRKSCQFFDLTICWPWIDPTHAIWLWRINHWGEPVCHLFEVIQPCRFWKSDPFYHSIIQWPETRLNLRNLTLRKKFSLIQKKIIAARPEFQFFIGWAYIIYVIWYMGCRENR